MTDLARALEQLEEDRLQRQHGLATVAAHVDSVLRQARAPLGSIARLAEVTLRCALRLKSALASMAAMEELRANKPFHRALDLAEENSRTLSATALRVSAILDEVRAFTRPDDEKGTVRLAALLDGVLLLLDDDVQGLIAVEKFYSCDPEIECRPAPMRQAFLYLIENAVEAMANRGTLTLRINQTGSGWSVEIQDTGPGVDPAIQSRLFTPGVSTRGRQGLGLSLAQRILAAHGGAVELMPSESGACFRVLLPASTHHPKPAVSNPGSSAGSTPAGSC